MPVHVIYKLELEDCIHTQTTQRMSIGSHEGSEVKQVTRLDDIIMNGWILLGPAHPPHKWKKMAQDTKTLSTLRREFSWKMDHRNSRKHAHQ